MAGFVKSGEFQPWVISWVKDRLDVTRIVMAQKWEGDPLDKAPKPPIEIPCVRTEISPEEGGGYGVTQFYYEGMAGESTQSIYEFQGSFNQEPITSHPKIGDLMQKYGGRLLDGEVEWDVTAPQGTKTKRGLNSKGAAKNDVNLMYGVTAYLSVGAVWTETKVYALDKIPDWIANGTGYIFMKGEVPGNPPTPKGRNWLEMSPQATQRGNVMQVTRSFMLSGQGGWIQDIYDGSDTQA